MKSLSLAAALAALLACPAAAHGPTPQRASGSVHVAAAPDAVWDLLRDPAAIADWHPEIDAASVEGEDRGARRTVTFAGGGQVVDGIDDVDDETHLIRWRLSEEDIEVFPVSYYTNDLGVAPQGEGAEITWKASFFRADTTNEPEERFSDEAAVEAMQRFIDTGLSGLRDSLEAH